MPEKLDQGDELLASGEETVDSDVDVFSVPKPGGDLVCLRYLAFEVGEVMCGVSISVQGVSEERKDYRFIETVSDEGEECV